MNDHDRITEMHTDLKWIKCKFEDHLKKHWWFTTVVVTLVIGAIVTGKLLA